MESNLVAFEAAAMRKDGCFFEEGIYPDLSIVAPPNGDGREPH